MEQSVPVGELVQNPDVDGSVLQVYTSFKTLGHGERWRTLAGKAPLGWEQSCLGTGLPSVRG